MNNEILCNYFGDRGVYFWPKGNCFSPIEETIKIMLNCFNILEWNSNLIFYRLKKDAHKLGMMDNAGISDNFDEKEINVIKIYGEIDDVKNNVIEVWCSISEEVFKQCLITENPKEIIQNYLKDCKK